MIASSLTLSQILLSCYLFLFSDDSSTTSLYLAYRSNSHISTTFLHSFTSIFIYSLSSTAHGYYSKEDGAKDVREQACTAIADSTADLDWRNRDVYHTMKNENIRNIHMIPFRDITAPLHDMHPEARDCTR
jgi:hypothetical protein